MIIDIFCHVQPQKFVEAIPRADSASGLHIPPNKYLYQIEERVKLLDKFKIDLQVLSLSIPYLYQKMSPQEALKLVKVGNDAVAEICEKNSDRFVGAATIPLLSGEFLDELHRVTQDLGMRAVQIFSNVNGKPLDSLEFRNFFEKAATYNVPLLIHPTAIQSYDWVEQYLLDRMFAWPFDTSLAVGRLVFGGVFDQFPNLKIIAHHGGGMIPFFEERIRGFYDHRVEMKHEVAMLARPPIDYFKQVYADTALFGSNAALQCTFSFFGADHTVFASDFPFGPEQGIRYLEKTLDSIKTLATNPDEKSQILEQNARKLLKLQ